MNDELVDVIDDKGNIVEVVLKKDAHTRGLLHKGVISQVISSEGKWLLVRQSSDKQDAGQYVSPVGGHVISGESNEEALLREAEEEVGLTGNLNYEYVGQEKYHRQIIGRDENHLLIMYKIYSDIDPILNEESDHFYHLTEEELSLELKNKPEHFGAGFHFIIQRFFPYLVS